MSTDEPRRWHDYFGLVWVDFFHGTGVRVDPEVDVSLQKQFIDVVLVRTDDAPIPRQLPDGFDGLAAHNLISFKSYQDTLDGWAVRELIGHGVAYRKFVSPSTDALLPEGDFRLFAVSARRPAGLDAWGGVRSVAAGVYDVTCVDLPVRVVVARELPEEPHNAPLHLFAAGERQLRYAVQHYRPFSPETSTLLWELIAQHGGSVPMAITFEELKRRQRRELFETATPAERQALLAGLPVAERQALLAGLPPDQVFAALTPEQRAELARLLRDAPPPAP